MKTYRVIFTLDTAVINATCEENAERAAREFADICGVEIGRLVRIERVAV